jgi:nucleoside phosphorylase
MLVDILLPARQNQVPSGRNSIELLRQIIEDGAIAPPDYIVGITADIGAAVEFGPEFNQLLTSVLHVAPGVDGWKQSLAAFIAHLRRAQETAAHFDFDVCVVNALRSPELTAVYEAWPVELEGERPLARNIMYRSGLLRTKTRELRVACTHLSQMGPISSTHVSQVVLQHFRPRVIVMTGICGGLDGRVSLGDVVVAEKSWDWQAGKWTHEGVLQTALDSKDGSPELVALARGVDGRMQEFHDAFMGVKPVASGELHVGPMVSGSAVVASTVIQGIFKDQHRKIAAVDMECYGLYYACANTAGPSTKALCVKGVSDLADRAKADDIQKYCSYMSALVALDVVSRYLP